MSRCFVTACLFVALGSLASTQARSKPNFVHDIAPITYQYCASCHHSGGPAPFALVTYEEVRQHARQIAPVVASRTMPPWLPEDGYGDFVGEARLSDAQIRLILQWANEGAPQGPASETPAPPPISQDWQLGKPDMVLQATRPFTVPASGPDVFWDFIFSPQITTTRYVKAIEILPGPLGMVHHANLLLDRTASARRQETTPGEGFPGMDLKIPHSTLDFPSHFLFWKPGSSPSIDPDGLSWRLDPGDDLVLNTHVITMGIPMQVQPAIGLYFTDKPPTRFPILIELENDNALDIPAGERDFILRDSFRLPVDCDVLAVYPHAHYRGGMCWRHTQRYPTADAGG